MEKLAFSIDKYTLKEASNDQLMEIEAYLVSDGINRHNTYISKEAIKNSAFTLVGKPILFAYSEYDEDFLGHEKNQISCGCVISEDDIRFEEVDGKFWLVCKGYIWKYYYPEVVEVFENSQEKSISMEIFVADSEEMEDGVVEIKDFVYSGFTLLGDKYNPAIPDANIKILKFSELVDETKNLLGIKEENKKDEEVDLVKFDKMEFAKKHNITVSEVIAKMQEQYQDGYVETFCSEYAYAYSWEKGKMEAVPYSMEEGVPVLDVAGCKEVRACFEVNESEEMEPVNFVKEVVEKEKAVLFAEKEALEAELTSSKEELAEVKCSLEEKEAKVAELEAEGEKLKEFKANVEESERKNQIDFAIHSVAKDLSQEQVEEWRNKAEEFENPKLFEQALKAFAYTIMDPKSKNKQSVDFEAIHIPRPEGNKENKNLGVWGRIGKNK